MAQADIVTGRQSGDSFLVEDRFSESFALPVVDAVSHLEDTTGGITQADGGWTTMEFTRTLVAQDALDHSFKIGQPTEFFVAFGATPDVTYHGPNVAIDTVQFVDSMSAPPGSNDPPPPPGTPTGPVVPCVLVAPHTDTAFRPLLMHMDHVWEEFDCNRFLSSLAAFFKIRRDRIKVIVAKRGSVIADLQVSHDPNDADPQLEEGVDALLADVAAGSPRMSAGGYNVITASSGDKSASQPTSGLAPWLLAIIVVAGVLVLAAAIVITVLLVRRHRQSKTGSSMSYVPLPETHYSAAATTAPISNFTPIELTMRSAYGFPGDAASSTIAGAAGEKFVVLKSDWDAAQGQEWVWASARGEQGYVPRSALH